MADLGMQYGQFSVPGLNPAQYGGGAVSGLAGIEGMRQQSQNQNLQTLFNQLMLQANQGKMAEFAANAPVREQERSLQLEYGRPERQTGLETKQEDLAQKRAQTPGIAATSRGKVDQETLDKMERDVQKFGLQLPNFQGPTAVSDFSDWAETQDWKKTSPQRKFMEQAKSPEDFQARGQYVLNQTSRNLADRRKERELLTTTGSQERQQDIQGQYSLERQRIANEGALATQKEKTDREKRVEKLEADMVRTMEQMDAAKEGSPEYKKLEAKLARLFQMSQLIKAAGAPYIPNVQMGGQQLMQPRGPQPLPGPQQAPQNVIRYDAQGNRIQ